MIYGYQAVRELLRHHPHAVSRVWIAARPGGRRQEIESLGRRSGAVVEEIAPGRLVELCGSPRHNGFAAEAAPIPVGGEATGGDVDLRVLLEDVQDPRNLGAILRVCEGVGVGAIYVRDRGSAPLSATVARASAGATAHLAVERITNSARSIRQHQADGFWVYGADPSGAPPWTLDLTGRLLLCLGGEERGLRRRTRELCDGLVGLPMRGRLDSLNVATAAAALLYEAVRQRLGRGTGG